MMSNFVRDTPCCTAASGVAFKAPQHIDAAIQSNGWDCGCHAIMNMRSIVATAVLDSMDWEDMALPTGTSAARDQLWREQIAKECLARAITLTIDRE